MTPQSSIIVFVCIKGGGKLVYLLFVGCKYYQRMCPSRLIIAASPTYPPLTSSAITGMPIMGEIILPF